VQSFKNLHHHQYQKQRKLVTKSWKMWDPGDLEESGVEESLWDGLLIEDEDEDVETMYWSE
jgi:hypothetical protein